MELSKREKRLALPRSISDPQYGFLGTVTKDGALWAARNPAGALIGHSTTGKGACKTLYQAAGFPHPF